MLPTERNLAIAFLLLTGEIIAYPQLVKNTTFPFFGVDPLKLFQKFCRALFLLFHFLIYETLNHEIHTRALCSLFVVYVL